MRWSPRSSGTATWDGKRFVLPLNVSAQRVVTGNAMIDPRFPGARVNGDLVFAGNRLTSDNLALTMKGLAARLALSGDMARGGYALAGPVVARGFAIENLGAVDGTAKILFKIGNGVPWTLQANLAGRMTRIDNATLQTLTGGGVRFTGGLALGERIPVTFRKARISSAKLQMALDGKVLPGGSAALTGSGRHADYGAFTVQAAMTNEGPNAVLVFASPLPAAGLKDVRVALSPIADGFRIETAGDSTLGPFTGTLGLFMPPGQGTRIDIQQFRVWQTDVTGGVTLGKDGVAGQIALAGEGTLRFDIRAVGGVDGVHLRHHHVDLERVVPGTMPALAGDEMQHAVAHLEARILGGAFDHRHLLGVAVADDDMRTIGGLDRVERADSDGLSGESGRGKCKACGRQCDCEFHVSSSPAARHRRRRWRS